jgi:hypothetical protein
MLRQWAADEYPNDLEAAFRRWCFYARWHGGTMRFKLWASDFRNQQDAAALRVLAAMDPDAFFRRHPCGPPLSSAPAYA